MWTPEMYSFPAALRDAQRSLEIELGEKANGAVSSKNWCGLLLDSPAKAL